MRGVGVGGGVGVGVGVGLVSYGGWRTNGRVQ